MISIIVLGTLLKKYVCSTDAHCSTAVLSGLNNFTAPGWSHKHPLAVMEASQAVSFGFICVKISEVSASTPIQCIQCDLLAMALSRNTGAVLLDKLNTSWFLLQVIKKWSLIPVSHWTSNRLSPSDVRLLPLMCKVESAIHSQLKWLWCVIIGSSIDWQWWKHDNWMDKYFFAFLPAQCSDTCWGTIHSFPHYEFVAYLHAAFCCFSGAFVHNLWIIEMGIRYDAIHYTLYRRCRDRDVAYNGYIQCHWYHK